MKIKGCVMSMIGKKRENNEDNFYFSNQILKEENCGLEKIIEKEINSTTFGIFDGMGGLPLGEKASHLGALELQKYCNSTSNFSMKEYFTKANERIKNYKSGKIHLGTTVSIIHFQEKQFEIGNIGDSRIYLLKKDKLIQVSKDHTEKLLFDELKIKLERKPRLIEYLGLKEEGFKIHPHIKKFSYRGIKKILMCTDGLTDMVEEEKIRKTLLKKESIKENMEDLIELVNQNGGEDNTTIMIFQILE
ncbi:MAG: serine/threonine-protein phosphatase [Bacilli bacterium]|nr:serine/threonine-protein phosphatase [Bacilli bacterium]